MGEAPDGLTLDRIDVNGAYELTNCRWATRQTQARNRRNNRLLTIDGETKTCVEWAELAGISKELLYIRLRRGWDAAKAVFTPSSKGKNGNHD